MRFGAVGVRRYCAAEASACDVVPHRALVEIVAGGTASEALPSQVPAGLGGVRGLAVRLVAHHAACDTRPLTRLERAVDGELQGHWRRRRRCRWRCGRFRWLRCVRPDWYWAGWRALLEQNQGLPLIGRQTRRVRVVGAGRLAGVKATVTGKLLRPNGRGRLLLLRRLALGQHRWVLLAIIPRSGCQGVVVWSPSARAEDWRWRAVQRWQ